MNLHRRSLFPLVALIFVLALGWGVSPVKGAATNVFFNDFSYTPKVVVVNVGDTVTWINQGGVHTATGTGADPVCGPGTIPTSFQRTFTTAGSFPYLCTVGSHAAFGMTGMVVVAAANIAPTVSISTPTNGAKFFAGSTFPVTFLASDTDGTVTKVDLYDGPDLIFSLPPPFTTNVFSEEGGNATVVAVATDNGGRTATSAPVTLQFLATNISLVSSLLPGSGPAFTVSNSVVGHTYFLEALTNFTSPFASRWFSLATNAAPSNHFLFSDGVLTNKIPRLYRVRQSL